MYLVELTLDTPEGENSTLIMTYRQGGRKRTQTTRKFIFPPDAEERLLGLILDDEIFHSVMFRDAPTAAEMLAGLEQEYKSL